MTTVKLNGAYNTKELTNKNYITNQYIISWENIKKVVPDEVDVFEKNFEDLLVYLRLTHNKVFSFENILEYCAVDNLEDSLIYQHLGTKEHLLLEDRLQSMYVLMCYADKSILSSFKNKTDVELNIGYNNEGRITYFFLNQDDIITFTPKATELKNKGIDFSLHIWTEY
jgi:hypothetical protein